MKKYSKTIKKIMKPESTRNNLKTYCGNGTEKLTLFQDVPFLLKAELFLINLAKLQSNYVFLTYPFEEVNYLPYNEKDFE